jgi:hypothetical protein
MPSWHGVILCGRTGLTVTTRFKDGSTTRAEVLWSEVARIVAFKRDVFAYDMICFGFETAEGCVEVDEEMEGWEEMIDALSSYLPGILGEADWWGKVVQPPFATNPTTLFTRS